ncbi:hypothetical protein D3C81_2135890 [compost metagenome]
MLSLHTVLPARNIVNATGRVDSATDTYYSCKLQQVKGNFQIVDLLLVDVDDIAQYTCRDNGLRAELAHFQTVKCIQ